jgi:hypothetical protein
MFVGHCLCFYLLERERVPFLLFIVFIFEQYTIIVDTGRCDMSSRTVWPRINLGTCMRSILGARYLRILSFL